MPEEMRFGLRIPACEAPHLVADEIVLAEDEGFDIAWIPDSQLLWRDPWVILGAAGARTSRILLGTNVTNPITRHSTVTASAAAAVDELSGGRMLLGIGSGDSSVRVMGIPTARIAQMREYVAQMRPLWAGQQIQLKGSAPFHLKGATGRQIPVYIAATGPKMLQLAGEIGDGAIILSGISKDALEFTFTNLEIGARRAGRDVADLEVATGLFCYITDDARSKMKFAQPYAALYAIRHRQNLEDAGIRVPETQEVTDIYPDLSHAEDWDRAIEMTEWVPEDLLEEFCKQFCMIGTGEEVADRVKLLSSYGVKNLYIRGFYSYAIPSDVRKAFAAEVIPRFRRESPNG